MDVWVESQKINGIEKVLILSILSITKINQNLLKPSKFFYNQDADNRKSIFSSTPKVIFKLTPTFLCLIKLKKISSRH